MSVHFKVMVASLTATTMQKFQTWMNQATGYLITFLLPFLDLFSCWFIAPYQDWLVFIQVCRVCSAKMLNLLRATWPMEP